MRRGTTPSTFLGHVAKASGGCRKRPSRGEDQAGAVLILALVYIIAISLVVLALSNLAMNDLNNTPKLSSLAKEQAAATNMTQIAMQYVRYNPLISYTQTPAPDASPLTACWGGNSISSLPIFDSSPQIAVWCSTVWNPESSLTRVVTFYACPINLNAAQCATSGSTLLKAQVTYDDYPVPTVPPVLSGPNQTLCTVECGQGMTVNDWIWGSSGNGSVAGVGVVHSMSFTNEPSDTFVNQTTTAAVKVFDAVGSPVVGDTVTLLVSTGPGPLASTSTLSAVTNTSGVASFTNLVPDLGGSYILTAADGAITVTSTSFVVSKLANAITVTSTAPGSATVGVTSPYTPAATASSADRVAITLDANSTGCTLNNSTGAVSFTSTGTCVIDFNDPGSATYVAAVQLQQSITVVVSISGSYSGSSSTSLPNSPGDYYAINTVGSVGSNSNHAANLLSPGVATTLTSIRFTISSSASSTSGITVGIYNNTTHNWNASNLVCTIPRGSTTCTITTSVTVPVGSSVNILAYGNGSRSGSWTVTYTQP